MVAEGAETLSEAWDRTRAAEIIASHAALPGATLPILNALQETFGHIDPEAEPMIAEALNLTRAEVHGVVTFYHDYRRAPAGRHTLRLCRSEACQSVGGRELSARCEAALGIASGETTPDGRLTLSPVYCLGLCALAPAALLDGRPLGRLDAAQLDAILTEIGE